MITKKRVGTDTCVDAINSDKNYCMRLRDAAGKDMHSKHNFREEVMDIINELRPPHFYANTIVMRLWKRGQWKHYIFEAPRDEELDFAKFKAADKHDDKLDALRFNMIWPPRYGKSVLGSQQMFKALYQNDWPILHKQAEGRAFRGKTADYIVMDDKIGELKVTSDNQKDLHAWVSKELNKAHRRIMDRTTVNFPPHGIDFAKVGTNLHMDFETIEKRVLADTGCTPEMLVNKPKALTKDMIHDIRRTLGKSAALGMAYGGSHTGRWNAGCYATKENSPYSFNQPKKEEHSMNKVTNPTFIGDYRATDITDDGLIQRIRQNEDEIRGLKQIKTKSKKIAKRIRKLQTSCTQMASILDAR